MQRFVPFSHTLYRIVCVPGAAPLGITILPVGSMDALVPSGSTIEISTLFLVAGLPFTVSLPNTSTVPPVLGTVLSPSGFSTMSAGITTFNVPVLQLSV